MVLKFSDPGVSCRLISHPYVPHARLDIIKGDIFRPELTDGAPEGHPTQYSTRDSTQW